MTRNVDPSIRACAHALVCEAIEAVAADLLRGVNFHVARDRAIETRADTWVSRYGRECANQAVGALHALLPSEFLSADERRILLARQAEGHRISLRLRGPGYDTWWNRLSIRLVGVPFAGIALATSVAALGIGGPSEALARSRQHVDAEWRALAACGVSKPGPGRERACRQFNSADRATVRSYDGPGAGAPLEWELSRAWE